MECQGKSNEDQDRPSEDLASLLKPLLLTDGAHQLSVCSDCFHSIEEEALSPLIHLALIPHTNLLRNVA